MHRKVRSLRFKFRKITIVPLILFGVLSLFASSFMIYTAMRNETASGLKSLAHTLYKICEESNKGDYTFHNNKILKGDVPIDEDFHIVDYIKETSGIDATIFWGNKRISTTIFDEAGNRAIGSESALEVQDIVLEDGEEYFSDNVYVYEKPYFGYYMPIKNSDHTIVGMIFVGKPRTMVLQSIYQSIAITLVILIFIITIVYLLALSFSKKIIRDLNSTKAFLGRITKGDVETPIDQQVLMRDDEIGEMGRFSVMLQKSVTELINTDTLTGLYNRRSCTLFLQNAVRDYYDNEIPFTLVIGDIDDFKHVNDTYGHASGDEVLKKIASIFTMHLGRNCFVARWGGEEFLFIFKYTKKEETLQQLEMLQDKIYTTDFTTSQNENISITMTFGLSEFNEDVDIDQILKDADEKLYLGKANGKNQIIVK